MAEKIKKEEPPIELDTRKQLPEPKGWKILVAMPVVKEKTEGGILKASDTKDIEESSNIGGYVMKLGPDCYNDERRFPSGAWCKKGDWVLIGRYAGARFSLEDDHEVRIINDDEVIGTIINPDDIKSA